MTEEQSRLSERLAWPIMALVFLGLVFAVVAAWGVQQSNPLAVLWIAILTGLLALSYRWLAKWRRELAEYVPLPEPPPPPYPDAPLRTYVEPGRWKSQLAWRISQSVVFLSALGLSFGMDVRGPGVALFAVLATAVYTGGMGGLIDGGRWLIQRAQRQELPREIPQAKSVKRLPLP